MREVAADSAALHIGFVGGLGGARMLVAEGDVIMHEVADRLHARPAERRMPEQAPRIVGQAIGLAITAAEQKQHALDREVLDLMLERSEIDRIGRARIPHDRIGAKAELSGRRDQARAPVSEAVAIAFQRDRRVGHQVVRTLQIGKTRGMHVQRYDHRRRLWKLKAKLTSDMNTHAGSVIFDRRLSAATRGPGDYQCNPSRRSNFRSSRVATRLLPGGRAICGRITGRAPKSRRRDRGRSCSAAPPSQAGIRRADRSPAPRRGCSASTA